MNVFEDLVVELKQNNLLESTVIEGEQAEREGSVDDLNDEFHQSNTLEFAIDDTDFEVIDAEVPTVEFVETSGDAPVELQTDGRANPLKKRAVSEVSSLQMVEHVLTGVEREHMKIVPNTFDDLSIKQALHAFLNADGSADEADTSAAEFALMRETETWCTALGERDRNIPVSSLRLYCENSKPALSSQALVGLARFYRNLPYSEQVRSKFDFTITRLFTRPDRDERRACLFNREDMLTHVTTLYKDWSSVPLYTADADDTNVTLTALGFEELAQEAEQASTFDQLIRGDFFTRLRLFKESISELFFAPNVTAAAIECNVRIGNAYINLIHLEREKMHEESLESKYGDLNEQAVSDAAARTLKLVDLLRGPAVTDGGDPDLTETAPLRVSFSTTTTVTPAKDGKPKRDLPPFLQRLRDNAANVNKWFLAFSLLLIAASVGVWVWANFAVNDRVSSSGVETIELQGTFMSEYIKTARVSTGNFYGVLEPTWETLPKEKRLEFAKKVLQAGEEKGFSQVSLINKDGKMAAFASASRVEILTP